MATVNDKMTAIADAIREKTGSTEALSLDGMAENIQTVYEAGKKSAYDMFWDALQCNGERSIYSLVFCNSDPYLAAEKKYNNWDETTFRPKYPIRPIECGSAIFCGLAIDNLKEHCEKYGIIIDFSIATTLTNCYRMIKSRYIPDMNVAKATTISSACYMADLLEESPNILNGELLTNYSNIYYGCRNMRKIPTLWAVNVTDYKNSFGVCDKLTTIENIVGEIMPNIDFRSCPLDIPTLKLIITHLKDYSGTSSEYTYTVTFKATAFAALEAEGATAEYNGVACTWAELIDNKKWNLVKA